MSALGLTWRRGGTEVAPSWQCHVGKGAAALGNTLAGATRSDEVRRWAHRREGTAGILGRMFWSPEDAAMAGGEVMSGGADRFNGGDAFRRGSGEDGERTVEALMPRCRWCGR